MRKSTKAVAISAGITLLLGGGAVFAVPHLTHQATTRPSDPTNAYVWLSRTTGKITRIGTPHRIPLFSSGYSANDLRLLYYDPTQQSLNDVFGAILPDTKYVPSAKLMLDGKYRTIQVGFDVTVYISSAASGAKYYNKYVATNKAIPGARRDSYGLFSLQDAIDNYGVAKLNAAFAKNSFPAFKVVASAPYSIAPNDTVAAKVAADWKKGMSALKTYQQVYGEWPSNRPSWQYTCRAYDLKVKNNADMAKAAAMFVPESSPEDFTSQIVSNTGFGTHTSMTFKTAQPCDVQD